MQANQPYQVYGNQQMQQNYNNININRTNNNVMYQQQPRLQQTGNFNNGQIVYNHEGNRTYSNSTGYPQPQPISGSQTRTTKPFS